MLAETGRLDKAIEDADHLGSIARAAADVQFAAEADLAASQALMFRNMAKQVIERLEPHEAGFTGEWSMTRFGLLGTRSVFFLGYMSMSAALLGDFDRARALVEAMNDAVDESGRPVDRYAGASHESTFHIVTGPGAAYAQRLAEMAEECRVRAPHPFYCVLLSKLGHVRLVFEGPEAACETLERAIDHATRSDMPHIRIYSEAIHACAESQANGPESLPALKRSLGAVRANGDPWLEILLLRAMADVTVPEEGLALLDRAETVAATQGMRPELTWIKAARAEIAELLDD